MKNARQVAIQILAPLISGAAACLFSLQSAAASSDACALITQAEVGAALGVAVRPGEYLIPTDKRFCTWHEPGNGQRRNARVSVITEQQYQAGKTPLSSLVVSAPESCIGDEAYFSKSKGMVYNLSVKKGANYLRIQARTNAAALEKANDAANDEKDKDRAVARGVLKNL